MNTKLNQEQIDRIEEKEKLVSDWFINTLPIIKYIRPTDRQINSAIHHSWLNVRKMLDQKGLEEPDYYCNPDPYCSYSGKKLTTVSELVMGLHTSISKKFNLPYTIEEMAILTLESDYISETDYQMPHLFFICYENQYSVPLTIRLATVFNSKDGEIWDMCEVLLAEREDNKPKPF